MQILSYLIASLIPLLSLYLIYKLDMYKTGEFKTILICGFAGWVAFQTAGFINGTLIRQGWLARMDVIRYAAPIIEEILKGLTLWYLVRQPKFNYFVEGAVYGFAAGIGFAIFENFQYIHGSPNAGFAIAASRVISTNLIHATTCSLLGIALGLARFQRIPRQILFSLGGLLIAMLLHVGYNNMVTRVNSGLLLVYAAVSGIGGAGAIAFAIRQGLKQEKIWIEEKLGMTDRVTKGEAAIVLRMENVKEILKPLAERFGDQKASQIEKFLISQAHLGIKRKSLDKLVDERMKRSVEEEITKLRVEMENAQRQVGSYAMLYLRHAIPADVSPVWGKLEAAIQERASAPQTAGKTNLWENLKARQEKADAEPKQESKS
jgi:RsiW-degrading membrane proteinase PrsW (M82 family)